MKTIEIAPGDLLEIPAHTGTELYEVTGVHLGAPGQASCVDLEPLNQSDAPHYQTSRKPFVPLRMIEAGVSAGLFTWTPLKALDTPEDAQ